MTQVFFTAAEIAAIAQTRGLTCWPYSESASLRRIKRDGWQSLPETLARQRAGREGGGGFEYHYSLLPEALQAAVASQRAQVVIAGRMEMEAERDRRQVEALRVSALPASARAVMEARAEVLVSIDGLAVSQGESGWFRTVGGVVRSAVRNRHSNGAVSVKCCTRSSLALWPSLAAEGWKIEKTGKRIK